MRSLKGRAALVIEEADFDVDQIVGITNIGLDDPRKLAPFALEWCGKEFADNVASGDFIIAARNFGYGHPHPQPMSTMRHLGIAAIICESACPYFAQGEGFNGFATIECPGILDAVNRWDELEVDWDNATIKNLTRQTSFGFPPLSATEMAAIEAGGFTHYLRNRSLSGSGRSGSAA